MIFHNSLLYQKLYKQIRMRLFAAVKESVLSIKKMFFEHSEDKKFICLAAVTIYSGANIQCDAIRWEQFLRKYRLGQL